MFISIFIILSCCASYSKKGGGSGGGPNLFSKKHWRALKLRPSAPSPDAGTRIHPMTRSTGRSISLCWGPGELRTQGGTEKLIRRTWRTIHIWQHCCLSLVFDVSSVFKHFYTTQVTEGRFFCSQGDVSKHAVRGRARPVGSFLWSSWLEASLLRPSRPWACRMNSARRCWRCLEGASRHIKWLEL